MELSGIERLMTSHNNLVYKLYLKDSTSLITRISTSRPLQALEYEAKLHEYLLNNGVNCPRIVENDACLVFNELTGKYYPSI